MCTFEHAKNLSYISFQIKITGTLNPYIDDIISHRLGFFKSPRFHGVSGGTGFKRRFDLSLGLLPSVLLISSLMASLRSVVKLVGQQAFILKYTHTRKQCMHANTDTHRKTHPSLLVHVCVCVLSTALQCFYSLTQLSPSSSLQFVCHHFHNHNPSPSLCPVHAR